MFSPDFFQQVAVYGGLTLGAVEPLKRLLKLKGFLAVLLSVLTAGVFCLPSLSQGLLNYLLYFGSSALFANGLFKVVHPIGK